LAANLPAGELAVLAANLPAGELAVLICHSEEYVYKLIKTDREIKIETSLNI